MTTTDKTLDGILDMLMKHNNILKQLMIQQHQIVQTLEQIQEDLIHTQTQTTYVSNGVNKMNEHINNIEGVYDIIKTPFNKLCGLVTLPELKQIE